MFRFLPDGKAKTGRPAPCGETAPRNEFPFFLGRMHDEFERLFERFEGEWPLVESDNWRWPVDVQEGDESVVIRAEAPGLAAGDFAVQVHDTYLTLAASWQEPTEGADPPKRRHCCETILLPPGVDEEKVTALYKDGALTVTVPLRPESRGRAVPVGSA
jgi:HSP20 family protein